MVEAGADGRSRCSGCYVQGKIEGGESSEGNKYAFHERQVRIKSLEQVQRKQMMTIGGVEYIRT